jgi:ribbon-helix-helix CopG family protein
VVANLVVAGFSPRFINQTNMKRTQLYLDDDIAKILSTVSRQKGKTVSELVRECVREKFGAKEKINKTELARELGGIWKNRTDLGDTEKYLRKVRTDTRRKRIKNG